MNIVQDLEESLEAIAATMSWKAVMHYEMGRLTGITMGTDSYVAETTGIEWRSGGTSFPLPADGRRLRLIKEET